VPLVVKVSVVLCAAVIGVSAMSTRASAATRHFLLTLTVVALLVLPVLVVALPEWPVLVGERAASPVATEL
jgi:ABC-type antimicrobial peptide transport system permease subunit